jgi:hypothetical protein
VTRKKENNDGMATNLFFLLPLFLFLLLLLLLFLFLCLRFLCRLTRTSSGSLLRFTGLLLLLFD